MEERNPNSRRAMEELIDEFLNAATGPDYPEDDEEDDYPEENDENDEENDPEEDDYPEEDDDENDEENDPEEDDEESRPNVTLNPELVSDFLDDSQMSMIDRSRTLTVLLLLETSEDCNKVKSFFDLASKLYGQPVSVVSFTRVQEALIYMNLDFTLTTNVYEYDFVNQAVTEQLFVEPQRLQPIPPRPEVIVVDDVKQNHPDFEHWIPDVFSDLKLMVLSADQTLAIREMDMLNPPLGFEAVERPFSTSRWRRRIEGPVADDVCVSLKEILREFKLDIFNIVNRGCAVVW